MSGHGKTVFACGCLAHQCRCAFGHATVTRLPHACPSCRGATTGGASITEPQPEPVIEVGQ